MRLHWTAYVSYGIQFVGVAFLLTGLGVNRLYTFSNDSSHTYGAFNACQTSNNNGVSYTCCTPIDNSCNAYGDSITSDCSLFNSVRAFYTIAAIAGIITLFANLVALTSLHLKGESTTWLKFGGLAVAGLCVGLAILTMILATSSKNHLYGDLKYDASFALLIVGWVLVLGSTVSFCFFAREGFTGFGTKA